MAITAAAIQAVVSVVGADKSKADIKSVSDSVNETSSRLASFAGGVALAAGAAFVGIGVASTKMAGDFQSGMNSIVNVGGEVQSNMAMISSGILKMAVDTGTATAQLTAGMIIIESTGYRGADALNVLKAAAEGAKSQNADLGIVTKALGAVMSDYNLSASQATSTTNDLIAVVQSGNTNLTDLAGAMATVAPTAAIAGVSLTDMSAAMATMTAKGTPAADAATFLKDAIMKIEDPTTAASKAMAAMGLKSSAVAAEMKVSLPDALQMITDAAAKKFPVGSSGYIAAVSKMIGSTQAMQAILLLTGANMSTFQGNVLHISDAVKQGGNSILGWADVQKDFNFQIDKAKEVVETLGIKIGTALLPIVGKLLEQIMPVVTQTGNWIIKSGIMEGAANSLVAGLKKVSDTVSGITVFFQKNQGAMENMKIAVIALAGALVGVLTPGIIASTVSFLALDVAALPWIALAGAIGAAVTLLVVGFISLYNSSLPVRTFFAEMGPVFSSLNPIFNQIWKDISGLVVPAWNDLVNAFQSAIPEFTVVGQLIVGVLLVALGLLISVIVALVAGVVAMSGGIIRIFTGLIEFIKGFCDIFGGLFLALYDVISGRTDDAVGHLQMAWNGVVLMLKGVWDAIAGVFMAAVGLVGGIIVGFVRTIVGYFTNLADQLVFHSIVPDMVNAIVSWFAQLPSRVGAWVQNMVTTVTNWVSQLPGKMLAVWNTIKNDIGTTWNWIQNTITSKADAIFNNIMSPFNKARDAIGGVVKSFVNNSIAVFNNGLSAIETFINLFGTGIDSIADALGAGKPIGHIPVGRIPSYATGTDAHPGGLAMVGERGPEMVWMPKGTKVAPHDKTNQILAGGKVPGYAGGIGDIASSILGWIGGGAKSLLDNVMNAMNIHISLPGKLGDIATGLVSKVSNWAVSWIEKILPKFGGLGPGGTPVNIPGNLQSWITQAMALAGAPASWANDLGIIAMAESGGNPNAINLTDSNAQAGHPSQGIMQTIPSTFAAYALPGHGNILNPVDNIIAGIRYIMSRYGDVFHVPGIISMANGGPYVGYANGTNFAPGGLAMVGERGPELMYVPRGAQITPNSQLNNALQPIVHIHNYIDGKEMTDPIANRIVKSSRGIGPIRSNS